MIDYDELEDLIEQYIKANAEERFDDATKIFEKIKEIKIEEQNRMTKYCSICGFSVRTDDGTYPAPIIPDGFTFVHEQCVKEKEYYHHNDAQKHLDKVIKDIKIMQFYT